MERSLRSNSWADAGSGAGADAAQPTTAQQIEERRLKAKALREQRENAAAARSRNPSSAGFLASDDVHIVSGGSPGQRKRPHESISATELPSSNRDASKKEVEIRPARSFAKYVDYNFSAMTDTKGGFLSTEDDPFNKALMAGKSGQNAEQRPQHMTLAEWERLQTIRNLKRLKQGPYEPGLSVLADKKEQKKCRECGGLEIDFVWEEVLHCCVCNACKEKFPEKYSLLTKTECKEDYLLTDPELKDVELLPHLSKPNPHKSHWHDMMLFLRYQVEAYAINEKWGSSEALDAEFERREADKKRRKEAKFKEKLLQLKKKTRTEAYRRNARIGGTGEAKAKNFGDSVGGGGKHVHEWGRAVENEQGMSVKRCVSCGMEVEELEF